MPAFLLLLFLGLLIRFLFIGSPGFVADISFWKSWSLAAIDQGVVAAAHSTNINYPPGFLYVLWFMGKSYSLFADPHNFNDFWRENNFLFLFASKSVAIVADVAIAVLIYWFASNKQLLKRLGAVFSNHESVLNSQLTTHNSQPLLLSMAFYFNPVVIIDSALWGQVESFGMIFTLIAIMLLFYKRPLLAAAIFTVGTQMKLQNIIYIPLFFFFIWRYFDFKTVIGALGSSVAAFIIINFPFVVARDTNHVLNLLTVNNDYFPWLSLNAHNLWWIVAGANGMNIIDKITLIGIANAKTIGLILFAACYTQAVLLIWKRPTPRNLFLGLAFVIFAFFLFSTQSHERYSYPILVLLLFFYPFLASRHPERNEVKSKDPFRVSLQGEPDRLLVSNGILRFTQNDIFFWILYGLLTLTIFFNVHWGLVANYPQYGFAPLTAISNAATTIANSYLLILLFMSLFYFFHSQVSLLLTACCLLLIPFGLLAVNAPFLLKDRLSLTAFKPISIQQGYASLQIDKSVNSFEGWKKWNRLSNNYFFYRKGFGTHANSRIIFDINRNFSVFESDVGVDTEAGTEASVTFQVFGDGRQLYTTPRMGRFDFPQHIRIPVAEVKRLELVVTDAGDGISSDHADWLNPILIK